MHYNFIAIEGNIGSGKTSLAKMLGEDMKASLILEEFADNPFLPKFYKNPEKYAFPLELSFLAETEPGSCRVNFSVKGEKELLDFSSKTKSIRLSDEVITRLERIPELEFNLIS